VPAAYLSGLRAAGEVERFLTEGDSATASPSRHNDDA
jgi:hypothetical protein